ncbi:MAG: IgGFc-binding protein, partial [Cryomorphaceae bacterium]|nr:IgGFc-binding protein [Cryomorphaceae bacterium]
MRNIILMLLMLCMIKINAQEKSILNPGTTFFLPSVTAKELFGQSTSVRFENWRYSITLISQKNTCVQIFGRDTSFVVQLSAFSPKNLEVPVNYLVFDTIQDNGLKILSDYPINIYLGYSFKDEASLGWRHSYSIYPIANSGSESIIYPYNFGLEKSIPPNSNSSADRFIISFEVVSHENNNEVEICFTGETRPSIDCFFSIWSNNPWCNLIFPPDTCIHFILNKSDRIAYAMGDKLENFSVKELRNSTIISKNNKPLSLFSRSRSAPNNLHPCFRNSDIMRYNLIQNLHSKNWSKTYYIPPRPEYPYFNLTCFSKDTLNYSLNGSLVHSPIIDTAFYPQEMVVKADSPFSLLTGTGPFLCDSLIFQNRRSFLSYPMVGPEHYYHRTCFAPFSHLDTIYNHYVVSLVVPTLGINGVRHNGTTLNASLFTPFSADSTYSWANIEVDTGYQ